MNVLSTLNDFAFDVKRGEFWIWNLDYNNIGKIIILKLK
jgi:hypothetical protein